MAQQTVMRPPRPQRHATRSAAVRRCWCAQALHGAKCHVLRSARQAAAPCRAQESQRSASGGGAARRRPACSKTYQTPRVPKNISSQLVRDKVVPQGLRACTAAGMLFAGAAPLAGGTCHPIGGAARPRLVPRCGQWPGMALIKMIMHSAIRSNGWAWRLPRSQMAAPAVMN